MEVRVRKNGQQITNFAGKSEAASRTGNSSPPAAVSSPGIPDPRKQVQLRKAQLLEQRDRAEQAYGVGGHGYPGLMIAISIGSIVGVVKDEARHKR